MATVSILLIMSSFYFIAYFIDAKYQMRFCDWVNGQCSNPFIKTEQKTQASTKDEQIAELKERIEVLEKCVTEPAYELNQKINAL